MNNKNKLVLGRGLDALIRPEREAVPTQNFSNEPVARQEMKSPDAPAMGKILVQNIEPNPYQPRRVFAPEALEELKKSIIANGLIQPVTVRKIADNRYQLVSGERRFRACSQIGYAEIPAYVLENVSDEAMLAMALIENIQREELNPIEVGLAYKRLMDECSLTQEEIAERVGKDRTTVANSIRLLKLPKEIQDSLVKGDISMGHARPLINLPGTAAQIYVLQKILAENLSVRKVEQMVKKILLEKGSPHAKTVKSSGSSAADTTLAGFEDDLRRLLGTKVLCKQNKDGKGEIVIEFYSSAEFERVVELLYGINQNY
ncbi:MAG: ParB/RepB/Spo0J family partition protein [Ignavibacteria bacterium]|nr:ParB/RepB/Spo0J family partition protein [Ignavibacteria bacterium]